MITEREKEMLEEYESELHEIICRNFFCHLYADNGMTREYYRDVTEQLEHSLSDSEVGIDTYADIYKRLFDDDITEITDKYKEEFCLHTMCHDIMKYHFTKIIKREQDEL